MKARSICIDVAKLRIERGNAERREKLEAQLADLTPAPGEHEVAQKVADPGASALATYLQALGIVVRPEVLSEWLVLVPVIALELGAALACSTGSGSGCTPPQSQVSTPLHHLTPRRTPRPPATTGKKCWSFTRPQSCLSKRSRCIPELKRGDRLLAVLREHGGSVSTSLRKMAELVGTTAPTLHYGCDGTSGERRSQNGR